MKIYITHLLQILNFSSTFRQSEIKNSLCRPAMVADNISNLVAPPRIFFISTGLVTIIKSTSTWYKVLKKWEHSKSFEFAILAS